MFYYISAQLCLIFAYIRTKADDFGCIATVFGGCNRCGCSKWIYIAACWSFSPRCGWRRSYRFDRNCSHRPSSFEASRQMVWYYQWYVVIGISDRACRWRSFRSESLLGMLSHNLQLSGLLTQHVALDLLHQSPNNRHCVCLRPYLSKIKFQTQ